MLVTGRVQGVWFRETCRERAVTAGLGGWVRNLHDGRVEAVFEGPEAAVEQLVEWCHHGPGARPGRRGRRAARGAHRRAGLPRALKAAAPPAARRFQARGPDGVPRLASERLATLRRVFLKSLTLRGFKSFADKTLLEFEPGVTVVVGPNGSGKSNLVDAVAWVLGAQGPRTLRGGKMDDVVFAGTPQRPALGRAEVSLTIDNTSGLLPIEFSEVTITRTLFRGG